MTCPRSFISRRLRVSNSSSFDSLNAVLLFPTTRRPCCRFINDVNLEKKRGRRGRRKRGKEEGRKAGKQEGRKGRKK